MSVSHLPKTYKAAVVEKANEPFAFRDLPLEAPTEGHILVKVLACGVCHSDAYVYGGGFGTLPRIPGHEIVGEVAAIPSTEKKWKVGDRVGGTWHGGHDGICRSCIKGLNQMCDNAEVNGVSRDGGCRFSQFKLTLLPCKVLIAHCLFADAEFCTLRTEAAVRIPIQLDPVQIAPLLCAGVTVYNGMKQMGIPQGETVAVQGLGGLGHLAVQYSRKMGYRTVALSSGGSKRDFAKELGASDYIDASKEEPAAALQKLGGASLIVSTAPSPDAMKGLVDGLAPKGKLLVLARK